MLGAFGWQLPLEMEAGDRILGYLSEPVTQNGKTIEIHAATSTVTGENCKIRIFRLGWYGGTGARQVAMSDYFHVEHQDFWDNNSKKISESVGDGCNWPIVYSLQVPKHWHSGLYIVRFELEDNKASIHPFWLTTPEPKGIVLMFSAISWQSRNWWGGASATTTHKGRPKKVKPLYYTIGSEKISFLRPMYNPRGGDALRWDYPFIRFIERNGIDIDYISDIDVESGGIDFKGIEHLISTGPARYSTRNIDSFLVNGVDNGMNYLHLGSEAGQHIVDFDSKKNQIQTLPQKIGSTIGERLENNLTNATISGSKPKAPWGDLELADGSKIKGILGSSWDRSIAEIGQEFVGTGKARHRLFVKRKVESQIIRTGGGYVFNAGCSNWSWALSDFGSQGNIKVDTNCQKFTWKLLELDESELNLIDDNIELENDDIGLANLSLDKLNELIQKEPKNYDALIRAAIALFEKNKFHDSMTYSERAINVKPNSTLSKYYFARCLHKLKRYAEMPRIYEDLLKKSPDKHHYIVQYGQLMIKLGHFDKASEVLEGALRLRDNDPDTLIAMASAAIGQRKLAKSESILEQVLLIDPTCIQAAVQYANIAREKLDLETSYYRWNKVLEINPKNYSAMMGLARYYLKSNMFDESEQILKSIISSPKLEHKISPYIELINLVTNHKMDYQEVIKLCNLAIKNTKEELKIYPHVAHTPIINLALSHSRIGNPKKGLRIIQGKLESVPLNHEYLLCISEIYRELGDYEKSFTSFVKIFDLPGIPNAEITSNSSVFSYTVDALHSKVISPKKDGPLVSVVMTAYMAEDLLNVAVSSILNQSWRNLELIIVDDCSPDETFTILQEMAEKDNRIKPVRLERNSGTYVAKNEGLCLASGKYVTFHDSDDWLHPQKIEMQVNLLEDNGDLVACTTNYLRVDENSRIMFHSKGCIRHGCISLMIRRNEVVTNVGYFDAVRVSADSEYESRIRFVFGRDSFYEDTSPMLIASVRSESLSQGGKFALEWNGIKGSRLEYRSAFESWHNSKFESKEELYIPHPLITRTFGAPSEMIW